MEIPPLAYGVALLALVLGILAGFVWFTNKVLRRRSGPGSASPSQMLADFREAHAAGELTDEEFQTIKVRLAPQLQAESDGAAGGATGMADAAAAMRGAADTLALGLGVANDRTSRTGQSGGGDGSDSMKGSEGGEGSGERGSEAGPPDSGDSTGDVR